MMKIGMMISASGSICVKNSTSPKAVRPRQRRHDSVYAPKTASARHRAVLSSEMMVELVTQVATG